MHRLKLYIQPLHSSNYPYMYNLDIRALIFILIFAENIQINFSNGCHSLVVFIAEIN